MYGSYAALACVPTKDLGMVQHEQGRALPSRQRSALS